MYVFSFLDGNFTGVYYVFLIDNICKLGLFKEISIIC